MGSRPLWVSLVTLVLLAAAAVIHVAAMRGAGALDKIRMKAAEDY